MQSTTEVKNGKRTGRYWLRDVYGYGCFGEISVVGDGGQLAYAYEFNNNYSVRPALCINLESLISGDGDNTPNLFTSFLEEDENHFVEIGEYPRTAVDDELFKTLEGLYNDGNLKEGLTCTGRLFTTNGQEHYGRDFLTREIPEFEYNGVRYVRDIVHKYSKNQTYMDGRIMPDIDSVQWKRVEPISFEIINWQDSWSTNPPRSRFLGKT